jgi:dihydroorotase
MRSLTVRNGTLATPSGLALADLQIIDGHITAIGSIPDDVGEVIDARGLTVLPGAIDPQVHFREPGLTHKEDLASGSRAAAAGGVTTFLEMPNTKPPTTTDEALDWKLERAAKTSVVDFGFFIGATKDNVDVLNRVEPACGIKIFMGSSTGDLLVSERADLEKIFGNGKRLIAVHAEDEARLKERIAAAAGTTDPAKHTEIRDATAARMATQLALELS